MGFKYTFIQVSVADLLNIQVLWAVAEGRRPLGRLRHRWKDNIKRDLQEVGWGGA
jgi:hypothetical protein